MDAYNGYCQLLLKTDGIYIKIVPPIEEGKAIAYEVVVQYLRGISLDQYDILAVMRACRNVAPGTEVKIKDGTIKPIGETLLVTIDKTEMKATGRFFPPSSGGSILDEDKIIEILEKNKVMSCYNRQAIKDFLDDRRYNTEFILAQGKEAEQGCNGSIKYHFDTNINAQPKINEDGSVDYHQLDLIKHVKAGDLLASLVPAIPGKQGVLVTGKTIEPAKVFNPVLKCGKNIRISEDGKEMYSEVAGHVYLVDDKVFVSNVYEVHADVDSSTGDIEYCGDIHVKGNVTSGFSLKADGQIIIDGVVEGGRIEAAGPIVIKGGIQGMNKGFIKSGSSLTAKFIENATVECGGDVTAEAILHSKVSAKNKIEALGKKGLIVGGEIKAGDSIIFKTAGSTMGTFTLLEVGTDPQIIEKYRSIENELKNNSQEISQLAQVANTYRTKISKGVQLTSKQLIAVRQITTRLKELEKDTQEKLILREELGEQVLVANTGSIVVNDKVYPGVKIVISNIVYMVKTVNHYCKFFKEGEDVVSKPI